MNLDRLPGWIRGDQYGPLLVSLVATLVLLPIIKDEHLERLITQTCFTLLFLTGVFANRRRTWVFASAMVVAAVGIGFSWIGPTEAGPLMTVHLIVEILFFGFTAMLILIAILRSPMSSVQAVFGAVCVYLLLGLSWAITYRLLECVGGEQFTFANRQIDTEIGGERPLTDLSQLIYYSFVTMTTLGYGDIAPRTPMAQTLSWMEAVFGQLYLAILIAKFVSELPRTSAQQ